MGQILAAVLETDGYVVGGDNGPSGLFLGGPHWSHVGWQNIRAFGVTVDPHHPSIIYLAAGNGVLRSTDSGVSWRMLTDWRITEVLDLIIDPVSIGHIIIATAHGIWETRDHGVQWTEENTGLETRFVQTLALSSDCTILFAGSETGVFSSPVDRLSWTRSGLDGIAVRAVSCLDGEIVIAACRHRGVWILHPNQTWRILEGLPSDKTFFAIAFDSRSGEWAVAGLSKGVTVSSSFDASSTTIHAGLPESAILSLSYDDQSVLRAGTNGDGVYRLSEGRWSFDGLPKSVVRDLVFVEDRS